MSLTLEMWDYTDLCDAVEVPGPITPGIVSEHMSSYLEKARAGLLGELTREHEVMFISHASSNICKCTGDTINPQICRIVRREMVLV